MSLSLTSADLGRLESLTRSLLSPLGASSQDAWLLEAGGQMRDLFGAALSIGTPFPDPVFRAICLEDPVLADDLSDFTIAAGTGLEFRDALLEAWFSRCSQLAATTWEGNRRVVEEMGFRMEESIFISDICRPVGLDDFASLHMATPVGFSSLLVMSEKRGGFRFGDATQDVLRLIAPSFKAGLDVFVRLGASRHTLDAVADPVVALDADGRELHRNAALVRLLGAEPERAAVEAELWRLAGDVRRLAFARRFEAPGGPGPTQRVARTARGKYTLTATTLPAGAFGPGEAVLVSVAAETGPEPLDAVEVGARHGLTSREAEVAVLLAEGLANAQIADRLFVSPATIKRHVESVLAKLAVPNRTAVAGRLLGTPTL